MRQAPARLKRRKTSLLPAQTRALMMPQTTRLDSRKRTTLHSQTREDPRPWLLASDSYFAIVPVLPAIAPMSCIVIGPV